MSRRSRIDTVVDHLLSRGHISEGSSLIEYGRFRLSDVIHRLRTDAAARLPADMEIVTIHKTDTKGASYGEYHLVPKASSAPRRQVNEARASTDPSAGRLQNGVGAGL